MKVLRPSSLLCALFLTSAVLAVPSSAQELVYTGFEEDVPSVFEEALKDAEIAVDDLEPGHLFEKLGNINADLRLRRIFDSGHWELEVAGVHEDGWYFSEGERLIFVPLPAKGADDYPAFEPAPGAVFLSPQGQNIDLLYEGAREDDRYVVKLLANHGIKNFPDAGEILLADNGGFVLDGTREFDREHPIKSVTRIDWWVIGGYMVLMLAIGFLVANRNKGGSDFFKGGSHMPWWLGGVSLFMSCFSTYTFVGGAGAAYDKIVLALILYFCNLSGFAFGYIILAARWRRTRSLTTMQYLEERYDNATHQLFSWVDVVTGFFYAGSWLLTLTVVVSSSLDLTKDQIIPTIIIMGLVILVYTVVGGFWAVCLTDMLQFIVLLPIVLILAWVSLSVAGGFGSIVANAPARFFSPTELPTEGYRDTWFIIANLAMMIFAFSSGAAAQRYFAVRNESGAKKVALLTGVLFIFGPVVWFIPPMVASWLTKTGQMTMVELMPGKPLAESSYILMCRRLLPSGLIGLVLAAMFAATMSSLDTLFNWRGAILTRDIIQKLFMPKASDRTLLVVGRIVTLFMGAIVIGLCIVMFLFTRSVFQLMFDLGAYILIPAGVPIVFGLVWRHTRKWSAFWAYLVGLMLGLGKFVFRAKFVQTAVNDLIDSLAAGGSVDEGAAWLVRWIGAFFGMDTGIHISYGLNVIVIGAVVAIIYFVPSLFSKERNRKYLDRVDTFWKKMHTPIDAETEVGPVTAGVSSFALTGVLTIIIGVGVFVLYPFNPNHLILWVGMITVAIGVLIWAAGRFAKEKE
ncbi:MAG: sodium:solute symporter family transporter [Planctomycetota bacterium]|jgi:SSS family transporter